MMNLDRAHVTELRRLLADYDAKAKVWRESDHSDPAANDAAKFNMLLTAASLVGYLKGCLPNG